MELNKFISVLVYLLLLTSLFTSTCRSENNETNIARNIRSIEINQDEFTEKTLIGHTSEIWDVGFSPDGELLASASSDNSILVWNASTGTIYQNLTGHQDSVYSLAFHPHDFVLASGSFDRTILIWNLVFGF
ncbi:MAG: WD40 repeat domain-containing protein [Candidatus Hodarchaeales archaeon]|jgi:WD40 repeat protein